MTEDEQLIKELQEKFETAESEWRGGDYSVRVSSVVFYSSAVRKIKESAFSTVEIQLEMIEFLESKLDEAIGKLEDGESEQVFRMSEEMGLV